MTVLSETLLRKYYANSLHPYRVYEKHVGRLLPPDAVLLDAGCGRAVPVLKKYLGQARRLIGIELVNFTDVPDGIDTYNADLSGMPLPDASVDLIMSRSVFEHLTDPEAVYKEFSRVLHPGGAVVFLTANMWDSGTLALWLRGSCPIASMPGSSGKWKDVPRRIPFQPLFEPIPVPMWNVWRILQGSRWSPSSTLANTPTT